MKIHTPLFSPIIYFLLVALHINSANLHAAGMPEPLVVPLSPVHDGSTTTGEQLVPSRGEGIMRITGVTQPSLTLYRARDENSSAPAVLVCPGGGYKILAWNIEGTEVAQWLNSIGVTAALLKYTVPENREAAFSDAQRALQLLRQRAGEWNIDTARVGMLGFSAGGHLTARTSTHGGETTASEATTGVDLTTRPDFAALVYPAYLADKSHKLAQEVSVTSGTPPMFIVQTQDDTKFVQGTILFATALHAAGIPTEMHLFPKGGHGYGLRPSPNAVSGWPKLCENWLRTNGIIPARAAPAHQ